jgi:hypothetical protein
MSTNMAVFLGCSAMETGRSLQAFQTFLLPPSSSGHWYLHYPTQNNSENGHLREMLGYNCGDSYSDISTLIVVHCKTCITIFLAAALPHMHQLLLLVEQTQLLGWSLLCYYAQSFTRCSLAVSRKPLFYITSPVSCLRESRFLHWTETDLENLVFFVQEGKIIAGRFVIDQGSIQAHGTCRLATSLQKLSTWPYTEWVIRKTHSHSFTFWFSLILSSHLCLHLMNVHFTT